MWYGNHFLSFPAHNVGNEKSKPCSKPSHASSIRIINSQKVQTRGKGSNHWGVKTSAWVAIDGAVARRVLESANEEAQRMGNSSIRSEHLLIALTMHGGVSMYVLREFDVDCESIRSAVSDSTRSESPRKTGSTAVAEQEELAERLLTDAFNEAKKLFHSYIGTEHLLLAITRNPESNAARILVDMQVSLESVREETLNLLGHGDQCKE